MGANRVGEDLSNMVLRPASNDQLELPQVVYLNPMLEHTQETFIIVPARRVVPEATILIQCE